jgi:hypothetical protein
LFGLEGQSQTAARRFGRTPREPNFREPGSARRPRGPGSTRSPSRACEWPCLRGCAGARSREPSHSPGRVQAAHNGHGPEPKRSPGWAEAPRNGRRTGHALARPGLRGTADGDLRRYPRRAGSREPPREPNFRRLRTAPERSRVHPFAFARVRMAVSERLGWHPIQPQTISQTAFEAWGRPCSPRAREGGREPRGGRAARKWR